MSDERSDPSQNTQAFQAWVERPQPAEAAKSRTLLWVGIAVAVLVVGVIVGFTLG